MKPFKIFCIFKGGLKMNKEHAFDKAFHCRYEALCYIQFFFYFGNAFLTSGNILTFEIDDLDFMFVF